AVLFASLTGCRQISAAQDGARSRGQFAHPQRFWFVVGLVKILARPLKALGWAEQGPAAGLVSGAAAMFGIHKRLRDENGMTIRLLALGTEPLQVQLQTAACQA